MQPRKIRLAAVEAGTTAIFLWIATCFLFSGSLAAQEAAKHEPRERDQSKGIAK